jgi:hypothetical protein
VRVTSVSCTPVIIFFLNAAPVKNCAQKPPSLYPVRTEEERRQGERLANEETSHNPICLDRALNAIARRDQAGSDSALGPAPMVIRTNRNTQSESWRTLPQSSAKNVRRSQVHILHPHKEKGLHFGGGKGGVRDKRSSSLALILPFPIRILISRNVRDDCGENVIYYGGGPDYMREGWRKSGGSIHLEATVYASQS